MINRTFGVLCLIVVIINLLTIYLIDFAPESWAYWAKSLESPNWLCFIGQDRNEPFSIRSLFELGALFFMMVCLIRYTRWSEKTIHGKRI